MKNKIIFFLLIVGFVTLGVLLTRNNGNGTINTKEAETGGFINIEILPKAALPVTLTGESEGVSYSINNSNSQIKLPAGKGVYKISSSGFEPASFEVIIYDGATSKTSITLTPKSDSNEKLIIDAFSRINPSISLNSGYWVKDVRTYSDDTWATGSLITSADPSDGERFVAKLESGAWRIVDSGTFFDIDSLSDLRAPQELIEEVSSL